MEGMQQKIFGSRVDAYVPAPIVEYLNSGVPMNEQIDERHIVLWCIGRRVRASPRLTEATKALATRDHVRDISEQSALTNTN